MSAKTLADLAPDGAIVAKVGDQLVDLSRPVADFEGADVSYPIAGDPDYLHVMRHSAAHVMAQAVLRIFPDAKYGIGPPITDGFYYDFDLPRPLTEDDIKQIESEMKKIVKERQRFSREDIAKTDAVKLFTEDLPQPYKVEILEGGDEEGQVKVGDVVSLYKNEDKFTDLCLGPHVPHTGRIGHTKLLRFSGAYWRGDEKRPQLQRIYGTAWPTKDALQAHLHRLEEAEKRDHRRLGVELDLFSQPDELGAGLFVWHPKGGMVRKLMEDYSREEHLRRGYDIVASPHIAREEMFAISGHLEQYADNMYPPMQAEESDYYLKPMNCPFHAVIYRSSTRSYRDLPLRYSELGTVYRHERSGTLHGMSRVRGLTQDDSHIFCRRDQLVDELLAVMDFTVQFYDTLGLKDPIVHLSTKPGKAIGTPEMWGDAEDALRAALDRSPFTYDVADGEGAFYGPKIDFDFMDAIGRAWQLTTIQCDFSTPERFGLKYVGADNQPHQPVMIHRALYGSIERFFSVYLEHTGGAFPPWLAPLQVRIVPIRDDVNDGARAIAARLREHGLRVDVDDVTGTMQSKVRKGAMEKIPWLLIVGPQELEKGTVSVRSRGGNEERDVSVDEFISRALAHVASRSVLVV